MIISSLKSLSRGVRFLLSLTIIIGLATAVFAYYAEKHLAIIRSATYSPDSYSTAEDLEGGYWWLSSMKEERIDTTYEYVEFTDLTRQMRRMPRMTSFAYSFKSGAVLSFKPLWLIDDSPEEEARLYEDVLDYWRYNCAGDYDILESLMPVLMESYEKLKHRNDDSCKDFLKELGMPVPSMMVTEMEKYSFRTPADTTYAPIPDLYLMSVDSDQMVLYHPFTEITLFYERLPELPQPMAPASLYYAQREFYKKYGYEGDEVAKEVLTNSEINKHFRQLYK